MPAEPQPDSGPEEIAYYVMGSLGRRRRVRPQPGWWSDEAHYELLGMVDEMVALGDQTIETEVRPPAAQPLAEPVVAAAALRGELVEQPA